VILGTAAARQKEIYMLRKSLAGLFALTIVTIAQPVLPLHASGTATIRVRTVRADTGSSAIGVEIHVATAVGEAPYATTAWGGFATIHVPDDATDAYIFGIAPNYGPTCYGYGYTPVTPGMTTSITIPIVCYPTGH
jgi:hypothetical protein